MTLKKTTPHKCRQRVPTRPIAQLTNRAGDDGTVGTRGTVPRSDLAVGIRCLGVRVTDCGLADRAFVTGEVVATSVVRANWALSGNTAVVAIANLGDAGQRAVVSIVLLVEAAGCAGSGHHASGAVAARVCCQAIGGVSHTIVVFLTLDAGVLASSGAEVHTHARLDVCRSVRRDAGSTQMRCNQAATVRADEMRSSGKRKSKPRPLVSTLQLPWHATIQVQGSIKFCPATRRREMLAVK